MTAAVYQLNTVQENESINYFSVLGCLFWKSQIQNEIILKQIDNEAEPLTKNHALHQRF